LKGPLSGWRILVTRPAEQAEQLCRLVEERGGQALRLPLMCIEAADEVPRLRDVMARCRKFDGWIFTSANAARIAAQLDSDSWPTLYAVGRATARELERQHRAGALVPAQGSSSEALLAMPAFQSVAGQRFLVCTGERGLGLIESTLRERGAETLTLALYRRVPAPHEPAAVRAAVQDSDAVILTSAESLQQLWTLVPEDLRGSLRALRLVTPSPRVVELARRLGFEQPLAPDEVSDEALLRCLESSLQNDAKLP
jgi:uroporphyrinogen-III synthase